MKLSDLPAQFRLASPEIAMGNRVAIWCGIVFIIGIAVRLALVLPQPPRQLNVWEPVNIALSLVNKSEYADAFGRASGPTAHCAPLHPALLAALFQVFGTGPEGARAMSIAGSVFAAGAFAFLPALSAVSGLGLTTGVAAGLAGALLPVNFWSQTTGGFDAPFTAALLVALLCMLSHVLVDGSLTHLGAVSLGMLGGLNLLCNPATLQVLAAWCVVFTFSFWHRLGKVLVFLGIVTCCVIAVLTPWALRNRRELGATIWTRSNFGLELYISNNDFLTADLERNTATQAYANLHPNVARGQREQVRAGGEVMYNEMKKREAFAWIKANQLRFLALTAERIRLFWLPRMHTAWQTAFEAGLTTMAFGGLVLLFRRQPRCAVMFVATLVAYPMVYYVIQVSPRYRFPLESILFLLAVYAASRFWDRLRRPSGPTFAQPALIEDAGRRV